MGRTCEQCGVKMPFGVRRNRIGGKLVCEGCRSGRPGRPLTQGSLYPRPGRALAARRHAAIDEWQRKDADLYERRIGDYRVVVWEAAAAPGTWAWQAFFHDYSQPGHDGAGDFESAEEAIADAEASLGRTAVRGLRSEGSLHRHALPVPPQMPAMQMSTGDPSGGAGTSTQAPDRQSDAIVRVCPFCGSGDVVGNGDGSVECGHDGIIFTVEVQPRHVSQPLVNPDGTPFDPSFDEADEYPDIGMASADEVAIDPLADDPTDLGAGAPAEGEDPATATALPSEGIDPSAATDPLADTPDNLPAEGEDPARR